MKKLTHALKKLKNERDELKKGRAGYQEELQIGLYPFGSRHGAITFGSFGSRHLPSLNQFK